MDVVITLFVMLVATLDGAKPQVHNGLEKNIPRLTLAAGASLDMENIKEGDDVYFLCHIVANPMVHKVQWFQNDKEIRQNISIGIFISNETALVLQGVTKSHSGEYTCKATNLQGSGISNAVPFRVKYLPRCRSRPIILYEVGIEEELNITCDVEADPEPFSYRWTFDNSSEFMDYPSDRTWVDGKGQSHASYTPHSLQDYGTILCSATNEIGRQRMPCIYNITHAEITDNGGSLASLVAVVVGVVVSLLIIGLVILVVVRSKRSQLRKPEVNAVYEKVAGCPSSDNDEDGGDCDPNPTDVLVTDDHPVTTTSETT